MPAEAVATFIIRMPPALHAKLTAWTKQDRCSMNALCVGLLEEAIDERTKAQEPGDA